ncbi:MAG: cupredoxin domain-containing protein [Dehalococcoidia bacterium]
MLAGALVATVPILLIAVVGNGSVVPVELVQVVVLVALAYGVFRWAARRWILILTTALTALALVGSLPYVVGDFSHPESGWAFVPSTLTIVALLVGVLAGVAATLRLSSAPARPLVAAAAALSLLLVLVGIVATLGVKDDARAANDISVKAKATAYPTTVEAKAGDIALYIENDDRIRHTFVIDDKDVKVELPGSANRRVTLSLATGTYAFHCDIPGHESMKGTLAVE